MCDSIRGQLTDVQMETDPPDVSSCFAPVNPFEGLETEHKQLKFYREPCGKSCLGHELFFCSEILCHGAIIIHNECFV